MKELPIEEKAKHYDELLKKLQEAKEDNDVCDERYCCVIDDIVPELKESEGEKTKRLLHTIANKMGQHLRDIFTEEEFQCFDAWSNVWLEKKGEQKHVEWSEEDKDMLRMLLEMINYASDHYQHDDKATDIKAWVLKSFKDRIQSQSTWKPSDEHIHGLIWVINRMPDIKNANEAEAVLRDLLEQLNKLRKE